MERLIAIGVFFGGCSFWESFDESLFVGVKKRVRMTEVFMVNVDIVQ